MTHETIAKLAGYALGVLSVLAVVGLTLALSGCASDPRATPASCQTTWMCFG